MIINGAVDMGMGIPHIGQGWGRIDFKNTVYLDQPKFSSMIP